MTAFVTAASREYLFLNGGRVLRVGDAPVEEAIERMRPIISHENEWWFRSLAPQYLRNLGILRGLKLAPLSGPARFTVRVASGEVREVELTSSTAPLIRPVQQTTGYSQVTLRRMDELYWAEYWPESLTLYIAYRQCQEMPGKPIAEFVAEITNLARQPIDTMVFDLRGNGGGNSIYFTRLLQGLQQTIAPAVLGNPRFRGFALIDRGVFSSGMLAVWDLKQPLALPPGVGPEDGSPVITTVGEPTGGKPGSYGEILRVSLPASGISLQYSTRYFSPPSYIRPGDTIVPDVRVPLRSTDYYARHDPYLAAVFARTGDPPALPTGDIVVVNGASFRPESGIAPGSFAAAFAAFPDPLPAVEVSGVPVTVLGASAQQIVFRVPESAIPGATTISVGTMRGQFTISAAGPGLFIADPANPQQPGAVLNQDSRLNREDSRARQGELLQIFGTGYSDDFAAQVWIAQRPAEVQYSGPAPGLPGLWQINMKVPEDASVGGLAPVFLSSGKRVSNPVTVWVE